ncbi:MAG: tetratricopeptide repeat protein [Balneolaceae bacterium]
MKYILTFLGFLLLSSSLTQAQADCKETPPGGLSPLAAYSLFSENYRNGDYQFALKYGRWITCAKPETLEGYAGFNLKKQYERLITIYEEVGKNKNDPAERTAHIDTALILFDESLDLFGDNQEDRFNILFNKGRFYQQNYDYIDDGLTKAYEEYEKLFEMNTEKALSLGGGYYLRVVLDNMVRKNRKEDAQEFINETKPLAEGDLLNFIEEKQRDMLGSPEEQIAYYEPILEEDPENIEALRALEGAYEQMGNREELARVKTKIHELQPSYESALGLAEMEESNANYSQAAMYYQEAIDRAENDEQKKRLYLELADALINQGELPEAKEQVNTAIAIDQNYGSAYIKMASIYAEAVSQCTEDRKLEAQDRVVYWVVIDYLNKAKNVDSSVANTANRQLSTYEPVTPSAEDKFFTLGYETGQEVKVDDSLMPCYSWINETVTVR